MKLRLDTITDRFDLQISGNEDWLKPIYAGFSVPAGQPPIVIKGNVSVIRETDEIFKVFGRLDFVPWVDCSRCGDPITWDVSGSYSYRAIPQSLDEVEDSSGERSFVYPDEEVLSYRDGILDLAELVNDQIQLAIPLQTINRSDSGDDCRDCGRSLSTPEVFKDPEDTEGTHRPFGILKNLKL